MMRELMKSWSYWSVIAMPQANALIWISLQFFSARGVQRGAGKV
jgi:hypothetical protein